MSLTVHRVLISVSDKTDIVPLAQALVDHGVEIISTGGTLCVLEEASIPVTSVTAITQFPEMMEGRVKTLHPLIYGGILALRDKTSHQEDLRAHQIIPIDLVVVNLYPFQETVAKAGTTQAEALEQIDIGGPSLLRAASKNFRHVAVVVHPEQYAQVLKRLQEGTLDRAYRWSLAQAAFGHVAMYDAMIAEYFYTHSYEEDGSATVADNSRLFPPLYIPAFEKVQSLRYGENPQQQAAFYRDVHETGGVGYARQLHGKELSYNNIVDMDAAWQAVWEFEEPAAAIIKHTNPCGLAVGETACEAYTRALASDETSAFGGIVAFNRDVDQATAQKVKEIFLEVVMAPHFTEEALSLLKEKKNVRLVELQAPMQEPLTMKKVSGGLLLQTEDRAQEEVASFTVVTTSAPTEEEWKALQFAWKVVKHVKSNAIVISDAKQTLGVGAGQMNRVGAAKIALEEAGILAKGAVLASDAFFPFGDTVALAAEYGIRAIIQPGGSIRDKESIAAANQAGIAMVFTHQRHFKH